MPLTSYQLAKIRQKDATTPEALKRNSLNDYTEGYFHVTLNTRGEAPLLGYITGQAGGTGASAPKCVLTELGQKVENEWRGIGRYYPECVCEEIQVMPEHMHALLHLLPANKAHLGRIINGLMIGCTHTYWDTLGIPWRQMRKQIEEALKRKVATTADTPSVNNQQKALLAQWQDRDHSRSLRGPALFVRGYNDVEALTAEEVQTKRQYIRTNVERRITKGEHPQLFCIHRNKKSANWTPERIMQGLCADRFIAADRNKQVAAWHHLTQKGLRNDRGHVDATLKLDNGVPLLDLIGNMELLRRPLLPLICHRSDAALFEQQKAAILKAAREQNAVIVTACVSPKERDIVKTLQQELLPVIAVMDNGFSERYKPCGKAFYAVAEALRLEVTPWEYEYLPREFHPAKDGQGRPVLNAAGHTEKEEMPHISREMCLVMNEVVRLISRKPDDWWKNAGFR